jgi:hypothetical protein
MSHLTPLWRLKAENRLPFASPGRGRFAPAIPQGRLLPSNMSPPCAPTERARSAGCICRARTLDDCERVMAGLSRARAESTQLGRRRIEDTDADKVAAIMAARAQGTGIRRIARDLGVCVGTVLGVTDRLDHRGSCSTPTGCCRLERERPTASEVPC